MGALPPYTAMVVKRNSTTSIGRGPLTTVASGVLCQLLQQAPAETDDNKGQTPLNIYTIVTYTPAWNPQPLPDIQVGDRLYDPNNVEYTVQGVKPVFGLYLEIQAAVPRGT